MVYHLGVIKNKSMIKEPYYTIDFTAIYCKFEILLNDVPIISLETDGQMSPNVPINFGIYKTGEQKIEILLHPISGEQYIDERSKFNYVVKLFDVSNGSFNHINDCLSESLTISKQSSFSHKAQFEAEVPYILNPTDNSKNLFEIMDRDKSEISIKLDKVFANLSEMLAFKNYDAFVNFIHPREANMATSMYLNRADSKARINSIIQDCEQGFKPMPLPLDKILKIYGNGKMATYKRSTGEPAFGLFNNMTGEELMLDLMFHIPTNKDEFEAI